MIQKVLRSAVAERYPPPRYSFEPLGHTRHYNVVRILDHETGRTLVAKGILHVEGNDEMGPAAMNRAFATESEVLSRLPAWWGFGLVDAFHAGSVRIIVTAELPTSSWSSYRPSVETDRAIAASLEKQIRWLHSKHIAHRDLELKNVLLTPDGPVIIDFEKAEMEASKEEMLDDWRKLLENLRESEDTRRIASFLAERVPFGRRKSVGGVRKSKKQKRGQTRRIRNHYKGCSISNIRMISFM